MREDRENLKDPVSGYASADLLDPDTGVPDESESSGNQRDPMSGYASADTLDATAQARNSQPGEGTVEPERDSMSGYASADLMEPDSEGNNQD